MKSIKRKKAFTLTELLVVVVIIGVLSAVALPRFNRVIETRRTGEAEEMLAAVRNEQEKRCTLDQTYAGTFKQMGDIVASASDTGVSASDNYTYKLGDKGVTAVSSSKAYTLAIPSYSDGRLCCEGDYCAKLNKNYPLCNALTAASDFKAADCVAEEGGTPDPGKPPLTPCEADPHSCECNPNQQKCCTSDQKWDGTQCVAKTHCDLEPNACDCNPNQAKCCTADQEWNGSYCQEKCKESYGPAVKLGSLPATDTCPKAKNTTKFSCSDDASFEGTCTDVYAQSGGSITLGALPQPQRSFYYYAAYREEVEIERPEKPGVEEFSCCTCESYLNGGKCNLGLCPGLTCGPVTVEPENPIVVKTYYSRQVTCCGGGEPPAEVCELNAAQCLAQGKIFNSGDCACTSCPVGQVTKDGVSCKANTCKARPWWSCGGAVAKDYSCLGAGTGWSGGTESFATYKDYITTYKCLDDDGQSCDCQLPSCVNDSFFKQHLGVCCKTPLGNRAECCVNIGKMADSNWCRPPAGQMCALKCSDCTNMLGQACGCPAGCMLSSTGSDTPPEGYIPPPGTSVDMEEGFIGGDTQLVGPSLSEKLDGTEAQIKPVLP